MQPAHAALFGVRGDDRIDVLVYNLSTDRVVGRRAFHESGIGDGGGQAQLNNVALSQSGKRVIVEFNSYGEGGRRGIVSYDRQLRDRVHLSKQGGTHFDACVTASGADDYSTIVSTELTTGRRTRLLPGGLLSSIHVSCRNVDRSGWAYISHCFDPNDRPLVNNDEVFAIRLDGSGTVERFAHEHHSARATYAREPHAVPSRDGSRVLWARLGEAARPGLRLRRRTAVTVAGRTVAA